MQGLCNLLVARNKGINSLYDVVLSSLLARSKVRMM